VSKKINDIELVKAEAEALYLKVNSQAYRVSWRDCSTLLDKATLAQRKHMRVSPSGYGIHWPELDEDLAIQPLLAKATKVTTKSRHQRLAPAP
jgi:hypothetical protein